MASDVELLVSTKDVLVCTAMSGTERLGEASTFELSLHSDIGIDVDALLGTPCLVVLRGTFDDRAVAGVITRLTAVATSRSTPHRKYQARVRSRLAPLELRRQTRVYQQLSVPDIVKEVVARAGAFPADAVRVGLTASYEPREYVVQYAESDATFVRRLCEEEGLWFRFEYEDDQEKLVLEDTSSSAPLAPAPLVVTDPTLIGPTPAAFDCRMTRRRRPGKVTLRDYFQEKPKLELEGVASAGNDVEKAVEVYDAPGRFRTPAGGERRARERLESLRADASTVVFDTNSVALAPGQRVALELDPAYRGASRPEGNHFVVAVQHEYRQHDRYRRSVEAIADSVPFRLPLVTPRPIVHGLHPAKVTGPAGQEIHTDAQGRVHVHFPWDRFGPDDDKSSLPIRTMQLHMPGSMAIPRVGWEVLVAFEDGDPDRPYVLGRTYNAKQPPPEPLPANKTVTRLGTFSSPGGGGLNGIQYDDAAGRQHFTVQAAFGKSTSVANNMLTQTVKNETMLLKGT